MVAAASVLCLSMVLFKEGENQNDRALTAIGDTVLTRTVERRQDVCEVILDKGQFSWTVHLKHPTLPALRTYKTKTIKHIGKDDIRMDAFNRAEKKAKQMLSSNYKPTHKFNYFNSHTKHCRGTRIDDLCFSHKKEAHLFAKEETKWHANTQSLDRTKPLSKKSLLITFVKSVTNTASMLKKKIATLTVT